MRVLFVHGYGLEGSGSSIYTRNLAHSLLQAGHDIDLLGHSSEIDGPAIEGLRQAGASFSPLPKSTLALTYPRAEFSGVRLVRDMSLAELQGASKAVETRLARAIEKRRPDLVIVNHFLHTAHGTVTAARRVGVPAMVVSHGTDIEYACAVSAAARQLGRETFQRAVHPVALNVTAAKRIAEVLGRSPGELSVVPPGVDISTFAPGQLCGRAPRVVQVGRLLLDKGPHLTIAALGFALAEHPDLELVLVGDGPDRPALARFVAAIDSGELAAAQQVLESMGTTPARRLMLAPVRLAFFRPPGLEVLRSLKGRLGRAVQFAGYRNAGDVASILSSARLAVLPSMVPECYPLTLLEAMASGCFVQASPMGGTAELLAEQRREGRMTARTVHPTHPVLSLLDGFRSTMDDWSPEAGHRVAARIRARHSWQTVAANLSGLGDSSLSGQRRPSPLWTAPIS